MFFNSTRKLLPRAAYFVTFPALRRFFGKSDQSPTCLHQLFTFYYKHCVLIQYMLVNKKYSQTIRKIIPDAHLRDQ